jgi:hypothetical protein
MNLPSLTELRRLFVALKKDISDDYRASDDSEDTTPGMSVTIGASLDGSWSYQTGDNSFTGGAYGHPHWAVVSLYRRSNSTEVAKDVLDQLAEAMAYESDEMERTALLSAGLHPSQTGGRTR